jgi:acylphosphatase
LTAATKRYVVSGRVQGVGFRYFVRAQAKKMNVRGWVRNRPDGSVEAVATADTEVLALFESSLRSGPPLASVENVESVETGEADELSGDFDSFEVRK